MEQKDMQEREGFPEHDGHEHDGPPDFKDFPENGGPPDFKDFPPPKGFLKPEDIPEFRNSPELDEMLAQKDVLKQNNKYKWRDNPPKVTRDEMVYALKYAAGADRLKCDCWNTRCPYYGDCRACVVFHLCLNQFPTCQRDMFGELEEYYFAKTQGK